MRAGLDLAPPNLLLDAAIATRPMRWLAMHLYFHSRGAKGLSFAEFEARIAAQVDHGLHSTQPGAA
jgi:digeranylgeranylglycerophospholipid reductase